MKEKDPLDPIKQLFVTVANIAQPNSGTIISDVYDDLEPARAFLHDDVKIVTTDLHAMYLAHWLLSFCEDPHVKATSEALQVSIHETVCRLSDSPEMMEMWKNRVEMASKAKAELDEKKAQRDSDMNGRDEYARPRCICGSSYSAHGNPSHACDAGGYTPMSEVG